MIILRFCAQNDDDHKKAMDDDDKMCAKNNQCKMHKIKNVSK